MNQLAAYLPMTATFPSGTATAKETVSV